MAHAGEEVGLGLIGLFGDGLRLFQFEGIFCEDVVPPFALRDIAGGGKNALEHAVAVIEVGGIVGNHGLGAILAAGREFVVSDFAFAEHAIDARFGPGGVGKVVFKRSPDQFLTGSAGEGFHLVIDIGNRAAGVGGHDGIDIGFDQGAGVELLVPQALIEFGALGFSEFSGGDILNDARHAAGFARRIEQVLTGFPNPSDFTIGTADAAFESPGAGAGLGLARTTRGMTDR